MRKANVQIIAENWGNVSVGAFAGVTNGEKKSVPGDGLCECVCIRRQLLSKHAYKIQLYHSILRVIMSYNKPH